MDSSDREEFLDAPESSPGGQNEEGDSSSTRKSDKVPPPEEQADLHAGTEAVSLCDTPGSPSVSHQQLTDSTSDTEREEVTKEEDTPVDDDKLKPDTEGCVTTTRTEANGNQSQTAPDSDSADPVPPEGVTVSNISSESVSLQWDTPAGEVETFIVTCDTDGETGQQLTTATNSVTFSSLKPGVSYSFQVSTQLRDGRRSSSTGTTATTEVPPPEEQADLHAGTEAVSLCDTPGSPSVSHQQLTDSTSDTEREEVTKEEDTPVDDDKLKPDTEGCVTTTRTEANGNQSQTAPDSDSADPVPPEGVTVSNISSESVSLQWDTPAGEVETFIVTCDTDGETGQQLTTATNSVTFSSLKPGVSYSFQVSTKLRDGRRSSSTGTTATTDPVPPEGVTVSNISSESVSLQWDTPAGEVATFIVTCDTDGETGQQLTTATNSVTFSSLKPGVSYSFQVSTQLRDGRRSSSTGTTATTEVPPPEEQADLHAGTEAVSLCDTPGSPSVSHQQLTDSTSDTEREEVTKEEDTPVDDDKLKPDTEGCVTTTRTEANGNQSQTAPDSDSADPVPPEGVTVSNISSESVSLQWDTPAGEVETFIVTCDTDGETGQQLTTATNSVTFSSLKPGVSYSFQVSTQLRDGRRSSSTGTTATTEVPPPEEQADLHAGTEAVSLCDTPGSPSVSHQQLTDSTSDTEREEVTKEEDTPVDDDKLKPDTEGCVTTTRTEANGNQSQTAPDSDSADPVPPEGVTVSNISSESVSLQWDTPAGEVETFIVTCDTDGETGQQLTTATNSVTFSSLKPGVSYSFQVSTQLRDGRRSSSTGTTATTDPVPPEGVTVSNISSESVSLQWDTPAGEVETFIVTCDTDGETGQQLTTATNSVTFSSLKPGVSYSFQVSTQLRDGRRSSSTGTTATTDPVPPEGVTVSNISSESVSLQWDTPAGEVETFIVTCDTDGETGQQLTTATNSVTFSSLKPGVSYSFQVSTQLRDGRRSSSTGTTATTDPVPPEGVTVSNISSESVSLQWDTPAGEVETFIVTCDTDGETGQQLTTATNSVTFSSLKPGVSYSFQVSTQLRDGRRSSSTGTTATTDPVPPEGVTVSNISSESVSLQWDTPAGEVETFIVTCDTDGETGQQLTTATNSVTFSSLKPGVSYSFQVSTQLRDGRRSSSTGTTATTRTHLESILDDLGLEQHYKQKLSLSKILQINERTTDDQPAKRKSDLPWYFLKKLMMVNATARNVKCTSAQTCHEVGVTAVLDFESLDISTNSADTLNPLDIITALFLCSDGFVQQELVLKMSMCQFAVPLLLPNCDTKQCTLMLWAMRDIVKKYRPKELSASKGFIEERMVLSKLPLISFVRLGECSLSKSEILNKLLSSSQQYHDTFVHHNMDCGNSPRQISNGLTEITWYLPGGNENIDVFSQPVAVANLRGDIASLETQFSFLCETSAAVFVFFDDLNSECGLLTNQPNKSKMFLVGNHQSKSFDVQHLKQVRAEMDLTTNNVILKKKGMNDADFVTCLRKTVQDVVEKTKKSISVEQMAAVAPELGIWVDENSTECQAGNQKAKEITDEIQDILQYKTIHLVLQGQTWKDITSIEKEEVRLRKLGSETIDKYRKNLRVEKNNLRKKQNSFKKSKAMSTFIKALSSPETERCYFLKWMRMNLDNVSRIKLSGLREQYKEKCQNSENKEDIKKIDQQLSSSSLGTEHFFREMGQIYEASRSLPETHPSRTQYNHLPKLCAQLLLDGFPLELVDGDASNIPLRWVSDVLSQLNQMVSPRNKILVVTVLGVQSTGKSTLLNTMFGVQFAVSSGRCTRGAFMLLLRIDEAFKKVLNCDFLMIIDTEGLKSPELAQLDNSYEHDNELATLVVGLSNITIINISMENSTEMKDILQIVVHAFLRMKEVGKKPKCLFVHQNVSDVSAHDQNLRDRKLLLEQLNEMTRAAAKMEKKEKYQRFTDVMDYNPDTGNCYVPGLWAGNPPMAPVNTGYSETIYELKKNIIHLLGNCKSSSNSVLDFKEWVSSLWNAVKHESFIFSFRNSLVAEAYMNLCTEFNKWEWKFSKEMYNWVTQAKTKISNFGTVASTSQTSDIGECLTDLKNEAIRVLSQWETKLLNNLTQYFKQTEGHVYLVEGHREEFANSARSLRKQMQRSVVDQLTVAVDMKRGMAEVNKIKENHTKEIETAVCALIDKCRKKRVEMTDSELDKEFEKMWKETLKELTFPKQESINIFNKVFYYLRSNLSKKGSHVCEMLDQIKLEDCGQEPPKSKKYEVNEELNKTRNETPNKQTTSKQESINIFKKMYNWARSFVLEKGSHGCEELDQKRMLDWSQEPTKYEKDGMVNSTRNKPFTRKGVRKQDMLEQQKAQIIIDACMESIIEKEKRKNNYHDTYIQEILNIIDERLQNTQEFEVGIEFEVNLKQHICGLAARRFQKMHEDFLKANDPHSCLMNNKEKFCTDFKDVFHERDQCQKKAEEFTKQCLKPAVENFVSEHLGSNIVDEMLKKPQFNTRMSFQYEVLKDLLSKPNYDEYLKFTSSYESYVKKRILQQVKKHFPLPSSTFEFEKRHLDSCISSIHDAITKAETVTKENVKTFIIDICKELGDKLVISQDALSAFMTLNNADQKKFAECLKVSVNDMAETLKETFPKEKFDTKLERLHMQPQNELFSRVIGCGKQCPFCKVPCEAGGEGHSEHFASLHRPEGLGRYKWDESKKLTTDICSSSVLSDNRFRCHETNNEWHPYKQYRDIFPDWKILPDESLEASDYWKYVMTKYNDDFAKEYVAKPADIPETWKTITKEQAEESLKKSFGLK